MHRNSLCSFSPLQTLEPRTGSEFLRRTRAFGKICRGAQSLNHPENSLRSHLIKSQQVSDFPSTSQGKIALQLSFSWAQGLGSPGAEAVDIFQHFPKYLAPKLRILGAWAPDVFIWLQSSLYNYPLTEDPSLFGEDPQVNLTMLCVKHAFSPNKMLKKMGTPCICLNCLWVYTWTKWHSVIQTTLK